MTSAVILGIHKVSVTPCCGSIRVSLWKWEWFNAIGLLRLLTFTCFLSCYSLPTLLAVFVSPWLSFCLYCKCVHISPLQLLCAISLVLTFILQSSALLLCNYSLMVAEHNIFLPWYNSVWLDSARTSKSLELASLADQEQSSNWGSKAGLTKSFIYNDDISLFKFHPLSHKKAHKHQTVQYIVVYI